MAAKGKKKKSNALFLLFGCIILCAAGYAALLVRDAKKEQETDAEETEEITLLSLEEDTLTSMAFKNSYGSMKLVRKKDTWLYADDKKFPVDQENAEDMESELLDVQAIREIVSNLENLEEYGLENPVMTITCATKTEEYTLYLGDESPSDDGGYYCYLDGKESVYEVDSSLLDTFDYSRQQMMELEDTPDIISSQVTKLSVKHIGEFDFTAVNKAMGDSSGWTIREPYETNVVGDESNLTTFFSSYGTMSYKGAVEYDCQDFSQYGLDASRPTTADIEISYYELVDVESDSDEEEETVQERVDHKAKILIGDQNEDGLYYVRVNNSSYVYLMSEDAVDDLLPDDAYTYVESTVSRISVDNMTKIIFTVGDKEYKITSKEKITTNDDGEEETETDYFLNKKAITISDFNAITTTWSTLETAKELKAEQKLQIDETAVVLTANLGSRKNRQTVSFLSFDKSYYAVKDGDALLFFIDKRDVDAFIEKLEQYAKA